MRIFILLFVLFSQTIQASTKLEYTLVDSVTLMVTADTLESTQEIRVEWFTTAHSGIIGYMDYDTMYFNVPVQDTFKIRSRAFMDVEHNGHIHTYWYWLHPFVTIELPEPIVTAPPVPTIATFNPVDFTINGNGWIYVIERFGDVVLNPIQINGIYQIDPYLFESGFYYIVFWSPTYQNSWTVYKP